GLNSPNVKVLFEKPFGVDFESAKEMVKRTSQYFDDSQIYRIDHYLAKEMAQNIVAFRSGNALLAHVWDSRAIESIDIYASETVGIEGRAIFYEQVGALRDFVQGHLMQLLSLVLMDIPPQLDWDKLPAQRLTALKSLEPVDVEKAMRAQYIGYPEDVNNAGSQTETFVSIKLKSTMPAWYDVPITLSTGKALDQKRTEIKINFKAFRGQLSNCLKFKIQPDEGVEIELFTKKPGYSRDLEKRKLEFRYPEDTELPEAYEQVIVDAINSHKSLFTSSEEILESWRVLQPLLDTWSLDDTPLLRYNRGASISEIIDSV
nr:glucose-6-phosphate dehydrogenase [bacterium]